MTGADGSDSFVLDAIEAAPACYLRLALRPVRGDGPEEGVAGRKMLAGREFQVLVGAGSGNRQILRTFVVLWMLRFCPL